MGLYESIKSTAMRLLLLLAAVHWCAGTGGKDSLFHTVVSTEWFWNGWRNVKFHAPNHRDSNFAKFWSPTDDCEAGLCAWMVENGTLRIRWGDAGWHTLRVTANETSPVSMQGVRE